jgi:hypothetical protein
MGSDPFLRTNDVIRLLARHLATDDADRIPREDAQPNVRPSGRKIEPADRIAATLPIELFRDQLRVRWTESRRRRVFAAGETARPRERIRH